MYATRFIPSVRQLDDLRNVISVKLLYEKNTKFEIPTTCKINLTYDVEI